MWYTDIRHIKSECVSLIEKRGMYYENSGTGIYYFKYGMRIWMILPLIFGGIALSQMSKGQRPSTGISVCVLLFCSFVGGILLLCAKDEDFYKPGTNYGYNPNMNNGYNPNMNNGYNPNMNNGYNANMNNNAYNPNANTGYSNANYAAPVNNTTADTTNNNFNNNGIQQ